MPIISLQRRLREVGRIRLGEQRTSARGKLYPAALPTFRFTSADREAIEAAAAVWGGQARPWEAPAGQQYEVTIQADKVRVVVPPTDLALSQWLELWSAAGCQRRCDGATEQLSDGPCLCDPDNRACTPHTRLNVLVPELPGFGMWRVEAHGYYAAVELAGVVDVLTRAAAAGRFMDATLRIDQRVTKRPDGKGGTTTQHYVVPVLDLGLTFGELLSAPVAPSSPPALPAEGQAGAGGSTPEGQAHSPALTPVPDLPAPPPVADQLDRLRQAQPRAPKVPLPPTGVDPETGEIGVPPPERMPEPEPAPAADGDGEGKGMAPPPSTTDPEKARKRVMAEATKTWPDASTAEREGLRHALGVVATYTSRQVIGQPPTQSVTEMSLDERLHLSTLMAQVRHGQLVLHSIDPQDGNPRYACHLKDGSRVAYLTQLAHDRWDVNVVRDDPQQGAQP